MLLVLCVSAQSQQKASVPPPPPGMLELKAAQEAYDEGEKSFSAAVDTVDVKRHNLWKVENDIPRLQTELNEAEAEQTTLEQELAAAKLVIDAAVSNITRYETGVVAPLNKLIAQQEQEYQNSFAPEKVKITQARNALSDWPPPLLASARKRLDDYEATIDVKLRKLQHYKKIQTQHALHLASFRRKHQLAIDTYQQKLYRLEAAKARVQKIKADIATTTTSVNNLKAQEDSALKLANVAKRKSAQDAANLQAALDWVVKNSNSQVSAALKAEHEAHKKYIEKRRAIKRVRKEAALAKQDETHLKERLRKDLLQATTKYSRAKDFHRQAEERVRDVKKSIERAQQALTDFRAYHGPIPAKANSTTGTAKSTPKRNTPLANTSPQVSTNSATAFSSNSTQPSTTEVVQIRS